MHASTLAQPAQPLSVLPAAPFVPSLRSWAGLCAACFFLAEVNGVTMPFVNTYLLERGWRYDTIGAAAAFAGLISLLVRTPGGFLIDRCLRRRELLAGASLLVGACFCLLPFASADPTWVIVLLAIAAVAQPLFGPLTNALTLNLAGHAGLNRAMGINQGWNHAGNLAAAVVAIILVSALPVTAVFFAVTAASLLAVGSVFLIRRDELHLRTSTPTVTGPPQAPTRFRELLGDSRVAVLLVSAALFHLANAPVMPLVAQKIKHLGGSNSQVAAVVLVAQAVMIPVALLAGLLGDRWGRKPLMAIGFAVLPVRILLYNITNDPSALVALQALDGIGVGIFDVLAVVICGDLTRGRGHFNALGGLLATAVGVGAVIGPLASGLLVQHFGFGSAFVTFAAVAACAAVLFVGLMPETRQVPEADVVGR